MLDSLGLKSKVDTLSLRVGGKFSRVEACGGSLSPSISLLLTL